MDAKELDKLKLDVRKSSKLVSAMKWQHRFLDTLGDERAESIQRLNEHLQTLRHRGYWSLALITVVVVLNLSSIAIVILIGMQKLTYSGDITVPSVVAVNFAETWALTQIAMKFYFGKDGNDK